MATVALPMAISANGTQAHVATRRASAARRQGDGVGVIVFALGTDAGRGGPVFTRWKPLVLLTDAAARKRAIGRLRRRAGHRAGSAPPPGAAPRRSRRPTPRRVRCGAGVGEGRWRVISRRNAKQSSDWCL